ncbi:MAG: hypothetical protein VKK59_02155 [Vampirovibrionales bacterium]|nr:hypothetical protein [Vampirovibrionales bacterium]
MVDVAAALDVLVPSAEYRGCLTGNTQAEFDTLIWEDARPKPSWEAIESADITPKLSKSERLRLAYQQLPVEKRVKYGAIMVQAKIFLEQGDSEAAAFQLSRLVVSQDEEPLKQAFIHIVSH